MADEPKYLDPPHSQLGYYWHDLAETVAYLRLLQWLVDRGHRMHPFVVAMRVEGGRLPLETCGFPPEAVRESWDWTVDRAVNAADWYPVQVRLVDERYGKIEVDLGYALMQAESIQAGDHHAVETVVSGSSLNLVKHVGIDEPEPALVEEASAAERWCQDTFRDICEQLAPDYAARRWEWELQPPASLLAASDPMELIDMFVGDSIADPELVMATFSTMGGWSAQRYANGVFAELIDRNQEEFPNAMAEGAEVIRGFLGSRQWEG